MDRITGRTLAARLFGGSPARTLALLQAAWPQAVGPELARRTEVLGIESGMLRVRVPDAGWRKVLHRMQPQILGRLREVAGDLAPRRMGFVEGGIAIGPSQAQSTATPHGSDDGSRPPTEPGGSAPPEIDTLAAAIPDPEIRERFAATAARYLARAKGHDDA
jgi:hypothetical protein